MFICQNSNQESENFTLYYCFTYFRGTIAIRTQVVYSMNTNTRSYKIWIPKIHIRDHYGHQTCVSLIDPCETIFEINQGKKYIYLTPQKDSFS